MSNTNNSNSSTDSNTSTITTGPTNFQNRMPIPRNELDIALQCITDTISNSMISNTISADTLRLQQEMIESLTSAITSCTVPMDDHEYKQHFIKYDTPMKRDIQKVASMKGDNNMNDDDDISLDPHELHDNDSMSCTEESSDSDEEEEDYLDTIALQRAKELREQVRHKVIETKTIKESKLSILLDSVNNEIKEWKKMHDNNTLNQQYQQRKEGTSDDNEQGKEEEQQQQRFVLNRLQSMGQSLSTLKSILQNIDIDLPDKLESLQNTTETVCKYIAKMENNNDNQQQQQSRVERAILSRVDRNKMISNNDGDNNLKKCNDSMTKNNNQKFCDMDAEQRFALFVSQTDSPWNTSM